eukprot:TRINITY_DN1059_c0_g1_i1.p1 TRINITY_DN1059_c0_g1~~TRINITY_DN1059_c0_g1_i1.p1  ORF type:complete len:744 (+),score=239.81 TRINITY_DN1059_c0_g1_i1:163-2394(+)
MIEGSPVAAHARPRGGRHASAAADSVMDHRARALQQRREQAGLHSPGGHAGGAAAASGTAAATATRMGHVKESPRVTWQYESEVHQLVTVPHTGDIVCAGGAPYRIGVHRVGKSASRLAKLLCCKPIGAGGEVVELAAHLAGHKQSVEVLALGLGKSPEVLYSGGADGFIHVWDTGTWKKRGALGQQDELWITRDGDSPYDVHAIAPMDGGKVATAAGDYQVKIWDVEAAAPYVSLAILDELPALHMAAGRNGMLYTADRQGAIKLWDTRAGKEVARLGRGCGDLTAHDAPISAFTYDRDRDQLFSGSFDCSVKRWDAPSCAPPVPARSYVGHKGLIRAVALRGDTVYTCSVNATVRVWDRDTSENRGISILSAAPSQVVPYGEDQFVVATRDRTLAIHDDFSGPLKPRRTFACPTAPEVLKATGWGAKTHVMVAGADVMNCNKIERKRATEEELYSGAGFLNIRSAADKRPSTSNGGELRSVLKRRGKRRGSKKKKVRWAAPEDGGPDAFCDSLNESKADRNKMLSARDALKETQLMAQANLRHNLRASSAGTALSGMAAMLSLSGREGSDAEEEDAARAPYGGEADEEGVSSPQQQGPCLQMVIGSMMIETESLNSSVASPVHGLKSRNSSVAASPVHGLKSRNSSVAASPVHGLRSISSASAGRSPMSVSGRFRVTQRAFPDAPAPAHPGGAGAAAPPGPAIEVQAPSSHGGDDEEPEPADWARRRSSVSLRHLSGVPLT